MTIKNISTSDFKTFILTLRQEQRKGFMLVKFQHKEGFFCGSLSDEQTIYSSYHETLESVDENSKELLLKKIVEIVEAAKGHVVFSNENDGEMSHLVKAEEVIEQPDVVAVESIKPQQNKQRRSRSKKVEE